MFNHCFQKLSDTSNLVPRFYSQVGAGHLTPCDWLVYSEVGPVKLTRRFHDQQSKKYLDAKIEF